MHNAMIVIPNWETILAPQKEEGDEAIIHAVDFDHKTGLQLLPSSITSAATSLFLTDRAKNDTIFIAS